MSCFRLGPAIVCFLNACFFLPQVLAQNDQEPPASSDTETLQIDSFTPLTSSSLLNVPMPAKSAGEIELEKALESKLQNPTDPKAHVLYGAICSRRGNLFGAWQAYSDSWRLEKRDDEVVDGLDRVFARFATQWSLTRVGRERLELEKDLGKPHRTETLDDGMIRCLYGSWAVDFRDDEIYSVTDLRDHAEMRTAAIQEVSFQSPDDLKLSTRVTSAGRTFIRYEFVNQLGLGMPPLLAIRRKINASASDKTMKAIVDEFVLGARDGSPGSKHEIIEQNEGSALVLSMYPGTEIIGRAEGTKPIHSLSRLFVGSSDLFEITYSISSHRAWRTAISNKWIECLSGATLRPAK